MSRRAQQKRDSLRNALSAGLVAMKRQHSSSADVMLKIAELGKRYKLRGPKDSSERIDELLWGKEWDKDE